MGRAPTDAEAAARLLTPEAVRERAGQLMAAAERDELAHFALDAGRLDVAADYVIETMRETYPDLDIPYHSRWRHFAAGGADRWARLAATLPDDDAERARIRFDLAVTSVLVDAGAGDRWRYREPETGQVFARSEGLAVASFRAFEAGLFSSQPERPLRADAGALMALSDDRLAAAFQAGDRVKHATFGEGIVVSCQPNGLDQEVTVAFRGGTGVKRLLLGFAPLERL